jgi:hypothetical protein
MFRRIAIATLAALPLLGVPGLAMGQGAPLTGPNAGAVHGQGWNMRQNLSGSPGPGAADPQRNQRVRQNAAPRQRQAAAPQRRASPTGAPRAPLTGGGTPGGRTSSSQERHDAQMAEARRRQVAAQRRAADAQDGVRLGR